MIENGMVLYSEPEENDPVCPVCGEVCETLYKDRWGNIVGCNECVEEKNAWEVLYGE